MSCSRIRFLLSEYLDGEVQGVDREMIEEHLAGCHDCVVHLEALRSTTRLLAEVAEVEPPAFLLEQIEAATTKRPTLLGRVRIAVFNLTRVPAPVRWATASVTAAAAIVLAMLSYNSEQPSKGVQISEVKQPTHSVTAPQHTPAEVKVSQPAPQPKVVVAKPRTVAVREVRPARHRSPVRTHTEVARELNKKPGHEEFRASEIPNAEVGVNVAAEPIPTEVPENTDAALIPNPTAPAEPQEIKLSPTAEAQPEWQKKEAEALADLRTKLAARNKQRRVQVHTEPIEGKKVTVELASIRF